MLLCHTSSVRPAVKLTRKNKSLAVGVELHLDGSAAVALCVCFFFLLLSGDSHTRS